RPTVILSLALAVSGCGHSTPFQSGDTRSNQPFSGGSPRRVTYNLGEDRAPAWLPDESGFVYSFERTDRPDHDRCLAWLPPDGAFRHVAQLRWLGSDVLVYLAQRVGYVAPCRGCELDTVRTGVELATLDRSLPTPAPVVLPGTQNASSVAGGETADVIYYTLSGDSRVFRRVLSSGADSVVHDFGAVGIARDA